MGQQTVIRLNRLPAEPLAAASKFHADWLPQALTALANEPENIVLVFEPADHTHRDWRLAAVRDLARAAVAVRLNGVAGEGKAIDAALGYLDRAPGVTGQYFDLDGDGAGNPLG